MHGFMTRFGSFAVAALLALFGATPSRAVTYTVDNTNGTCVSSRTITAADSGMTSTAYSVRVYASNGQRVSSSNYTAGINTSNYNLSMTFSSGAFPNGFCGVVKLKGLFPGPDTTASGDFEGTAAYANITVSHQGSYSRRTYNGKVYAADVDGAAGVVSGNMNCIGYIHVYFDADGGQLTFAHSYSPACFSWVSNGKVVSGSGFPSGSVPIGTFYQYVPSIYSSSYVLRTSDDRPF